MLLLDSAPTSTATVTNAPENKLLEGLNDRQREAVLCTEGPLLVLAGAGSGKTRVLITRIAHLIRDRGVQASEILGITFTRKAAGEMRERLAHLLGEEEARQVTLLTFHALGVQLLREFGGVAGIAGRFGIADESDTAARVRIVLRSLGVPRNAPGERPGDVQTRIRVAKMAWVDLLARDVAAAGRTPDDLIGRYRAGDPTIWGRIGAKLDAPCLDRFQEQFAAYQAALAADNVVDYEDLIALPLLIFLSRPDVLRLAAMKWRYVLVDEYQDTDYAQDHLLRLLVSDHRNLCVVGDDAQSIYSFRGAKVDNIRTFPERYAPCTVVTLDENYRSSPTILAAANASLEAWPEPSSLPKTLWTRRVGGDPLRVWTCGTQEVEAIGVAEDIRKALEQGLIHNYDDVLVLYRVNAIARGIEQALRRDGIPYRMVGGVPLHESKEARDLIAYLKVADNPYDVVSFERALGSPARGIGPSTVECIVGYARVANISLLDAAKRADEIPNVRPKQAEALRAFAQIVSEVIRTAETHGVAVALQQLLQATGLHTRLVEELAQLDAEEDEEAYERCLRRVHDLEDFMLYVEEYCRTRGLQSRSRTGHPAVVSIGTFLDELVTLSPNEFDRARTDSRCVPDDDADLGAVTLMTVHSAKGLEAKRVYVVGLEEQVFPTNGRKDNDEQIAEESRLFYVALTRARDHLVLSSCMTRELKRGDVRPMTRSRFLAGLPETVFRFERRR